MKRSTRATKSRTTKTGTTRRTQSSQTVSSQLSQITSMSTALHQVRSNSSHSVPSTSRQITFSSHRGNIGGSGIAGRRSFSTSSSHSASDSLPTFTNVSNTHLISKRTISSTSASPSRMASPVVNITHTSQPMTTTSISSRSMQSRDVPTQSFQRPRIPAVPTLTQTQRLMSTTTADSHQTPRVLMTGACGQVGSEVLSELRRMYGVENVIATDVRVPPKGYPRENFQYLDVMDKTAINKIIVDNEITWVVHLASILSAVGEKNPQMALQLNTRGIENVLEAARVHKLRVFAPSTIAAFGPSTPMDNTPDETIMRPNTMYGVTKVYLELLGEYYKSKFGVDFRSIRYPGVISSSAPPGGGTTDYAVEIYHEALLKGKYTSFLHEDSALPMMYGPDCIKATIAILTADASRLTQSTYNITGMSFTPKEIAENIKKYIPHFEMDYAPDFRQAIADSWPNSLDDSMAQRDFDWSPDYDLDRMTRDMLVTLKDRYNIPDSELTLQM